MSDWVGIFIILISLFFVGFALGVKWGGEPMRAIDADELYEKLDKIRKEEVALYGVGNSRFCCTLSTALTEIDDAPTIEPEIVRCKDCKHRIEHKHYGDLGESAYTCEGNMDGWILPDGFCSLAERRTE